MLLTWKRMVQQSLFLHHLSRMMTHRRTSGFQRLKVSNLTLTHWKSGFSPIKDYVLHPYHPMGGDFFCGHLTLNTQRKNTCHIHVHHIHTCTAKQTPFMSKVRWGQWSGITVLRVHGSWVWFQSFPVESVESVIKTDRFTHYISGI